jgi:hypothetical protein
MRAGRFFFAFGLTDRSSGCRRLPFVAGSRPCLRAAFSPGNFFADFLDRTVI